MLAATGDGPVRRSITFNLSGISRDKAERETHRSLHVCDRRCSVRPTHMELPARSVIAVAVALSACLSALRVSLPAHLLLPGLDGIRHCAGMRWVDGGDGPPGRSDVAIPTLLHNRFVHPRSLFLVVAGCSWQRDMHAMQYQGETARCPWFLFFPSSSFVFAR